MKKTITKLALKREAIRTLVDAELAAIAGGADPNCTNVSQIFSSCPLIAVAWPQAALNKHR